MQGAIESRFKAQLWDHQFPFSQKRMRIIELIVRETEQVPQEVEKPPARLDQKSLDRRHARSSVEARPSSAAPIQRISDLETE